MTPEIGVLFSGRQHHLTITNETLTGTHIMNALESATTLEIWTFADRTQDRPGLGYKRLVASFTLPSYPSPENIEGLCKKAAAAAGLTWVAGSEPQHQNSRSFYSHDRISGNQVYIYGDEPPEGLSPLSVAYSHFAAERAEVKKTALT